MKAKRKRVRHVFGLVREDAAGFVYTFKLTKQGLNVHRLNSRRKNDVLVGFDRLAAAACLSEEVEGRTVRFALVPGAGVEVRQDGESVAVLSFARVANGARRQPVLLEVAK